MKQLPLDYLVEDVVVFNRQDNTMYKDCDVYLGENYCYIRNYPYKGQTFSMNITPNCFNSMFLILNKEFEPTELFVALYGKVYEREKL